MASDKDIGRMIEEIEKLKTQIKNLKSKVKRRKIKLQRIFVPLERQEIEFEIELLKGKIRKYEIVEMKLTLPLIKAIGNLPEKKLEDRVDWSKAGRA